MAQQVINVGVVANDGTGDPIRTAYIKCNDNFGELYSRAQTSPPPTLVGSIGDQAGMYAYDSTYFYYCFADYDGINAIWAQVSQIGNVSVNQLVNGTSSVTIPFLNGPATISVGGISNVALFTSTGTSIQGTVSVGELQSSGTVSATGTITGGNIQTAGQVTVSNDINAGGTVTAGFFVGDGSGLTNLSGGGGGGNSIVNGFSSITIPVSSGNIHVDVGLVSDLAMFTQQGITVLGAISATSLQGTLSTASQPNITSVGTLSTLTATGNIVGGNLITSGQISATANVMGGNVLTLGIVSASGSASAANFSTTGAISATGTITGGSLNTIGPISSTGNITGGNMITSGVIFAASGLQTSGSLSATGNVMAQYFIGDGSLLTNVSSGSGYGNANVAAYLPTYTGNLSGGNLSLYGTANVGSNLNISGTTNASGPVNANVVGQLTGPVNGINILYGMWDFGNIDGVTFSNPVAWIFSTTAAGNIDMGTINSPASYNFDIGTIY